MAQPDQRVRPSSAQEGASQRRSTELVSDQVPRIRYTAGGPVQVGGGIYLERPADRELLDHCLEGDFVYILTARQLGKSSLMFRTAEALASVGCRAVVIDLQSIGKPERAEQWYRGLLLEIESQLELGMDVQRWWEAHADLGLAHRFTHFLREVVAARTTERVVFFVDEIDTTLSQDYTDDFFIAIRYLYGARAKEPALARLSFVLIGVATPSDLIKDAQRTPFNIGHRVEMTDFTREEAADLALGLPGSERERALVLERVLHWTSGHPYLTLSAFASLCSRPAEDWTAKAVDERIAELFFSKAAESEHNLQFVRAMLTDKAPDRNRILDLLASTQRGKRVRDHQQDLSTNWLKLSGVVVAAGGLLRVRNRIYERVFSAAWARANRAVDWPRRFRQLILATVAVAAALSVLLVPWFVASRNTTMALGRERAALQQVKDEKARVQAALRKAEELAAQRDAQKNRAESALKAEEEARTAAQKERDNANTARDRAVAATQAAQVNLRRSQSLQLASEAARLAETPDYTVGGLLATESAQLRRAVRSGGGSNEVLRRFSQQGLLLVGHEKAVVFAAWSPDGRRVVTASWDNTARVWNAEGSGQPIVLAGHERAVNAAEWSPEGRRVVTASSDKTARVWNADGSGQPIVLAGHEGRVVSAAWSPEGWRVVTASDDGTARVWKADGSGQPIVLAGHEGRVVSTARSPDGRRVVTASGDKTARVWNADGSGQPIVLAGHDSDVVSAEWSPEERRVVTASEDGTARVWKADGSGQPIVLAGHEGRVVSAEWSPDGRRVVTASGDKTARVWNADGSGKPIVLAGHDESVNAAAWSPDGRRGVTASSDKTARVWNADGSGEAVVLRGHKGGVLAAAWSPDGSQILTASEDGTVRIWLTDPTTLIPVICRGAGRNLTPEEWRTYVPDRPYHATCAEYLTTRGK